MISMEPLPKCLNIEAWRASTPAEVAEFMDIDRSNRPKSNMLVVRSRLRPVDIYAYLKTRFGEPNGFGNVVRRDDSDNLIHWDFNIKAEEVDIYFHATARQVHILVSEVLTDEQWKELIVAIRADYARIAQAKSEMMKSFEKSAA